MGWQLAGSFGLVVSGQSVGNVPRLRVGLPWVTMGWQLAGSFGLVVSDQSVGNVPCSRVGLPSNRTSTALPFSRTTVV